MISLSDLPDCQNTMNRYLGELRDLLSEQERQRAGRFNDFDYSGAACFASDDYKLQAKIDALKVKMADMEREHAGNGMRGRRGSISAVAQG